MEWSKNEAHGGNPAGIQHGVEQLELRLSDQDI